MKTKTFTTMAALLGTALISHAQTRPDFQTRPATSPSTQQSEPGASGGRADSNQTDRNQTDRAEGTQRSGQAGQTGAGQPGQASRAGQSGQTGAYQSGQSGQAGQTGSEEANRKITAKLEKWGDADSEKIEMSEVPSRVKDAVQTIAGSTDLDDQATRLTKDGESVYCVDFSPEGQESMKVFVSEDGGVQMAKQKATFEDLPAAVRNTITQHADNQSPEEVYRILAESSTVYVAKAKDNGDNKVKMITVSSAGQHIDTQSKDKSKKRGE